MRRGVTIVWLVLMIAGLTGCGLIGSDEDDAAAAANAPVYNAAGQVLQPRAPRNRALPSDDPAVYEAPASVSGYTRLAAEGSPLAAESGGSQATYQGERASVRVNTYRFETAEAAAETVRYTLESPAMAKRLDAPYYGSRVSFGLAQDRQDGYLAAWSHDEWAFVARTTGSLDDLKAFLDSFPY